MRTIEQQRATDALERVQALAAEGDDFKSRYRSYIERLGPAIVMNSLGQALATERAAAGMGEPEGLEARAHAAVYQSVHRWLCRSADGVYAGAGDLLEAIVRGEEAEYLRAQAEGLAWLQWHKKFCRAAFPKPNGGD